MLDSAVEKLKEFMGDLTLPLPVVKLALKKCNLKLEETICMIIDEN